MFIVKALLAVLIAGIVEFIFLFAWVMIMEFIHRNDSKDKSEV